MKKINISILLFLVPFFGTLASVVAQDQTSPTLDRVAAQNPHIRATLDTSPAVTPPEAYQHIRATMGGSSDGRRSNSGDDSYSPYRNSLEIEYGSYSIPNDSTDPSASESKRYSGISFIHKFTPHFALGAGYEHISHEATDSYVDDNYFPYYTEEKDKSTASFDIYKLLLRFIFVPDKPLNPELTIGLGGYTEHWEDSWSYIDYYNGVESGYGAGDWTGSVSGFTGSAGVGVRCNITKRFSAGAEGKLAYFRSSGYWFHLWQYGIFAGMGF